MKFKKIALLSLCCLTMKETESTWCGEMDVSQYNLLLLEREIIQTAFKKNAINNAKKVVDNNLLVNSSSTVIPELVNILFEIPELNGYGDSPKLVECIYLLIALHIVSNQEFTAEVLQNNGISFFMYHNAQHNQSLRLLLSNLLLDSFKNLSFCCCPKLVSNEWNLIRFLCEKRDLKNTITPDNKFWSIKNILSTEIDYYVLSGNFWLAAAAVIKEAYTEICRKEGEQLQQLKATAHLYQLYKLLSIIINHHRK
jgi:hypothetical protein